MIFRDPQQSTPVGAALGVSLFLITSLPAQLVWNPVASASRPGPTSRFVMADGPNGPVLFGAVSRGSGLVAETWQVTAAGLVQLLPGTMPNVRQRHAMAFDEARGRIVLFGGLPIGSSTASADTWEFDGTAWVRRTTQTAPPARSGHAMAYAPGLGGVVLFGGSGSAPRGPLDDTWLFDGNDWRRLAASGAAPWPRSAASMATAPDGGLVLFGGIDQFGELADTWFLRAGAWSRMVVRGGLQPEARRNAVLVLDRGRGRVTLHGGESNRSAGTTFDDTWELTARGWSPIQLQTPGPATARAAAAYDRARGGRILVYGGWEYRPSGTNRERDTLSAFVPTARASIQRLTPGCGGIDSIDFSGMPLLGSSLFGGRMPQPPGFRVPAAVNVSATADPSNPIVLAGCNIALTGQSLWFPATGGNFLLPVPNLAAIRGATVFVQGIGEEVVRGTGFDGLASSPAYALTIGD